MNTHLLRVIGVMAAASLVASCAQLTSSRYTNWKCFTIDRTIPPPPHAELGDQFCVVTRGEAPNLQWALDPGAGMSNWQAIGGGPRMALVVVDDTATAKSWEFEVDITDHDTLPPSDHGREHKKPNSGYALQVFVPADATAKAQAQIRIAGREIFGGVATSTEN